MTYLRVVQYPNGESAARIGNLCSREDDPYRLAVHTPIVGLKEEGGDSLGPGEADHYRVALRRPWTPDSDPEIEVLLQLVLQLQ